MKVGIVELRNLVAAAVKAALTEAKKGGRRPKDIQPRTPEALDAQRSRQVRGTGYSHSDPSNFAEPLGDDSLYRKQGASGMGGWTGESRKHLQKMVEMVVREEIQAIRKRIVG